MRIGLIGLGDIAKKAYLPIIANLSGVTPVLCTRNAEALVLLGNKYRIDEHYQDVSSAINSGLDAAMVHSSTDSHAEITKQLLEAGIPTFVDKPVSYHLDDTKRIIDLSAHKDTLLFVGFNRRYAPLITDIDEPSPVQLFLKKNRPYLPGDPRVFIYDDFIHVVDTLRYLSSDKIENLQSWAYKEGDQLGALQVQWQSGSTLVTGSMNRVSGTDKESLDIYGQQQRWQINQLSQGEHHTQSGITQLGFNDWQATLYKRGFVDMLNTFIQQAQTKHAKCKQLEDILATHELCEVVLKKTENTNYV
jgi:virulence factor